jgi:hypothetical protein
VPVAFVHAESSKNGSVGSGAPVAVVFVSFVLRPPKTYSCPPSRDRAGARDLGQHRAEIAPRRAVVAAEERLRATRARCHPADHPQRAPVRAGCAAAIEADAPARGEHHDHAPPAHPIIVTDDGTPVSR